MSTTTRSKQPPRPASGLEPVRVAIVGGGCAGLTAAWELTQRNAERGEQRYQITVFEQSWALGGKGASHRDAHNRIREHGLHVWLGFYENAFRLMRECYGYLQDQKLAQKYDAIEHAFFPEHHLGAALRDRSEGWEAWTGVFPPAEGLPGTPLNEGTNPFTLSSYVVQLLGMAKTLIHSIVAPPDGDTSRDTRAAWGYATAADLNTPTAAYAGVAPSSSAAKTSGGSPPGSSQPRPAVETRNTRSRLDVEVAIAEPDDSVASVDLLFESLGRLVRIGTRISSASLLQAFAILETILQQRSAVAMQRFAVLDVLEAMVKQTRKLLASFVNVDDDIRRRTEIIDLVMTIVVGLFRDRVLFSPRGLEIIDDVDCREWLIRHGATYSAANCAFVRGLYDLAFAYRDGEKELPSLAAGQGLRGALRMFFTYRGAICWRMRAGMGDVIFSPLYRALRTRGVNFKFGYRLAKASFSADLAAKGSGRVTQLDFEVLLRPKAAGGSWTPLDKGFWPDNAQQCFELNEPPIGERWTADSPGAMGFDAVVMAHGKDDFDVTCRDLCDAVPLYGQMRDKCKTVATQATQFWFKASFADLGWQRGPVIMTGMEGQLDSWADMTHTLAAEEPHGEYAGANGPDIKLVPKAVAYMCGAFPDSSVPAGGKNDDKQHAADALVQMHAYEFLESRAALDSLIGPAYDDAFAQQHFQANILGSARYALSLPDTLKYRISPLDGTIDNMTIAGDWTDCGFNEGCVEAAVMSGRLAAHALDGALPTLDEIIGYHHP